MHLMSLDESALRVCLAQGAAYWESRGVKCGPDALPPRFVIEHCLERMLANPERGWWSQLWLFVAESPERIVGSAAFKSFDAVSGTAEIGYGVVPGEWRRGFATEAVRELVAAAFARPEARAVFGLVQPGNTASRRVLEKNGFAIVGEQIDPEDGPVLRYGKGKPPQI